MPLLHVTWGHTKRTRTLNATRELGRRSGGHRRKMAKYLQQPSTYFQPLTTCRPANPPSRQPATPTLASWCCNFIISQQNRSMDGVLSYCCYRLSPPFTRWNFTIIEWFHSPSFPITTFQPALPTVTTTTNF